MSWNRTLGIARLSVWLRILVGFVAMVTTVFAVNAHGSVAAPNKTDDLRLRQLSPRYDGQPEMCAWRTCTPSGHAAELVGIRSEEVVHSHGGRPDHRLAQNPNSVAPKPVSVVETEAVAPRPLKPQEATQAWDDFLGEGPQSNVHPRTGLPDPDRIVSADGTRSIRMGPHEMNSSPTKFHYHEETWTYDPATNAWHVDNTVVRVPGPKGTK